MRRHRLFVDEPLSIDRPLELAGERARYVQQVLRLKAGQRLSLFDGRGSEYEAELTKVSRQGVSLRVYDYTGAGVESPLRVHVGQGVARGDRMDYAIQKAVELGTAEFTPLFSERSVVRLEGARAERRTEHWRGVAVHASEQCGRTRVTTINPPCAIDQWLAEVRSELKICLDPSAGQCLTAIADEPRSVTLLIGPEGGLTAAEMEAADAAGFERVLLGPRTLRAETATVAGLTAVQMTWGDLG